MCRSLSLCCAAALLASFAVAARAGEPNLPLVFADDFTKGADAWQPTDPDSQARDSIAAPSAFVVSSSAMNVPCFIGSMPLKYLARKPADPPAGRG